MNRILLLMVAVATAAGLGAQKPVAQPANKMTAFVNALMAKMTVDEKIGQLNLLNPGGGVATGAVVSSGVESKIKSGGVGALFGIIGVDKIRQAQQLAVSSSRLKIPMIFGSDVIHGYKTTFPVPLALSCSWDLAMIERSARLAAEEATADGLSWVYSPMVDIARDPRWGRVVEGAGEDTYLGSKIAAAMVKGYQGNDLAANNTVMACVKHFALYGAAEAGRDYNSVDMSRLKMYETYLPPYRAAIDAGAGSVMTSFNDIDGIPASGNKWLMTDLLRKQWGFKGFVVTDYTAINEMVDHGVGDLQVASALALKAGVDMDMVGEGFLTTLKKSLQQGKVTQRQIDDGCRRVLEAKYKLGLFEDPFRYCDSSRTQREVLSADKRTAAREFGARSCVLLKNNNQTLPLKKSGTIALIGPLANNKSNMLGTWAVSGEPQLSVPVLDGMRSVGGSGVNILYAKGANITDDTALAKKVNVFGVRADVDSLSPDQLLTQALEVAGRADVIVAVVGEASEMSGEAASRSDISLPVNQQRLLQALAKTGKPLVVVLMNGRPLILNMEAELATSLLDVWFQGHEAGNAIADVLFGNYNPSGKLTMTFPRNVGQIPIYYNHKNTGRPQGAGPTQKFRSNYLDVSNEPLFPFGFGLSYTTFSYSEIKLNRTSMRAADQLQLRVTLSNTGQFDGEEVVQLYLHDEYASITQPVKKLKAFQKIRLQAGESKDIVFNLTVDDLKFVGSDLKPIYEPGNFTVFVGGNSRDLKQAKFVLVP
ncbi:beta-glucosidase BglX [Segetibacter sp. 3557_3]|uniref:beta-glucosidase BglX n=1 Tax=Segetibacter sp. 3557_3 TaxID=2547429 RepID=UPI0010585452|nr:beta-glucosidase BglX [Segetibacter sp. 3557_3]TDH23061.1 beta-glucosidase BglX [Segetibacter sp. 3557_3]